MPPLLRADTIAQLGGVMSDLFSLLPRLGSRLITFLIYLAAALMALYLFVIHGWAFVFVRSAQRAFVATFVSNTTAVTEF